MIFNSPQFAIFLAIVFTLYWALFPKSTKGRNVLLLGASLYFYSVADWRYLILLIFSILANYYIAIKIANSEKDSIRKQLLWLGLIVNLGVLFYFKYFNFFYDSFADLFNLFGGNVNYSSFKIILPLGISFITFQTLGYIIDVYYEEIEPSRDLLEFSTYVAFFPKLLAGPIERAQNFIPQIQTIRNFNPTMAIDGLRQILWGLFAKIVIADNCAVIVDSIFDNYQNESGSTLFIGAFYYAFQIYGDFSGYSNISIGVAKLFGIQLMANFLTPYFSTNISDFWKKWHISLTTWLMDYVYTPLSFTLRKYKKKGLIFSIILTFILVGLWHGASWNYIIFGLLHGLYFIPLIYGGSSDRTSTVAKDKYFPSFKEFLKMSGLFILVMLTDVFFRAADTQEAISYLGNIFSVSFFIVPDLKKLMFIPVIIVFVVIEWIGRNNQHALESNKQSTYLRWAAYILIGFVVVLSYDNNQSNFIYLQF